MDVKMFNESGKGYWMEGDGCLRANETNSMGAHLVVIKTEENESVRVDEVIAFDAYQHHNWRKSETIGTLTTESCGHVSGDTPLVVIALEGNGSRPSHQGNGYSEDGVMYTINTIERHSVCYENMTEKEEKVLVAISSTNSNAEITDGSIAPTLRARGGTGGGNIPLVVYDARGNGDGKTVPTLTDEAIVYPKRTGALCANSHPGSYSGQDAYNDMLVTIKGEDMGNGRKYILRRLTPLECCRLQGFPDWWCDGVEGSDSNIYKMWGNGIALPCAADVFGRIAKAMEEEDAN